MNKECICILYLHESSSIFFFIFLIFCSVRDISGLRLSPLLLVCHKEMRAELRVYKERQINSYYATKGSVYQQLPFPRTTTVPAAQPKVTPPKVASHIANFLIHLSSVLAHWQ